MGINKLIKHTKFVGATVVFALSISSCSNNNGRDAKQGFKPWLQRFMETELDSLMKQNSEGTKITMITDGSGESNDNGQGLETEKFQELDFLAEMDGIMEYARVNIEDNTKFDKWVDSSINRQGYWMRITHYTAKDSAGGLQFVDIYELEQRDFGEKSWTVYPPLSALGEAEDNAASDRNRKGEMAVRKYQCYLVTWDYKQRTWWMDRDIRAFYQKSAKSFGYKIRENAIWSQPKGLDVQVNLSNELWLNND